MTHAGKNPTDKTLPALRKHPRSSCDGNRPDQDSFDGGQGDNGAGALINGWVCVRFCVRVHTRAQTLGVCSQQSLAGMLHGGVMLLEIDGPAGHSGLSIPRKTAGTCANGAAGLLAQSPPRVRSVLIQLDPTMQGHGG